MGGTRNQVIENREVSLTEIRDGARIQRNVRNEECSSEFAENKGAKKCSSEFIENKQLSQFSRLVTEKKGAYHEILDRAVGIPAHSAATASPVALASPARGRGPLI